MKCNNCKVKINATFGFAIAQNQCPACGKSIMNKEHLASYLALQTLLKDHIEINKVDKIVSMIVANFELKQIFNDISGEDTEVIEEDVEIYEDADPDAESKKAQLKQGKEILKKLRDEALSGALKERYGMGDEGIILNDDGTLNTFEMERKQKLQDSREAITENGESSFRRI